MMGFGIGCGGGNGVEEAKAMGMKGGMVERCIGKTKG
jgi:hypothetical protein